MRTKHGRHWLVFGICLVVVFVFKFNILHLGYFWDEMGAYAGPAQTLSEGSLWTAFPGQHSPEMFYGHPPLLFLLLAVVFKMFGHHPFAPHVVTVFFASLGVYGTYRLTHFLSGFREGVLAATLLFFSPIYFAQSGICTADIFVASLSVWVIYFYAKNDLGLAALTGICLSMVKLTALGVFLSIILYEFYLSVTIARIEIKRLALLSMPLVVAVVFLALQWGTTGRLVPNDYFDTRNFFATIDIFQLGVKAFDIFYFVFIDQFRFITSIAALWLLIGTLPGKQRIFILFFILIAFYISAFSVIFYLPRYIVLIFPFYFSIVSIQMCKIIKQRYVADISVVLVSTVFIFLSFRYNHNDGLIDATMQYADFVNVHQQAANYIERKYNDIVLISDYPFIDAVHDDGYGFVTKPIKTTENFNEANTAAFFTKPNKQKYQLSAFLSEGFVPVKMFTVGSCEFTILRRQQ
jgi:4-amino-4-deoxy-L-arabinose transferase-like glycosyltransferase